MKREEYQKVKEIFQSALNVAPAERARYLNEKCTTDSGLRREVERLLNSYDSDYLEQPAFGKMAELVASDGLAAGQKVGRYKIIEKIGAGGMGEVFLAEDTRLKRRIALKILPAVFGEDKERLRRFEQEARAASALNHPNILTIHEFGTEDDRVFIASEFVEGETLRARLRAAPIALSEALEIAVQVAAALVAAHESGIVHRDIKPENIMLRGDGLVKVLDFGLAKLVETKKAAVDNEGETLSQINTSPGLIMGTVNYMSPEQARGKTFDARTDIFSFGVVTFEMLCGRLPFTGENELDVIASILHAEPPPLSRFARDVSPELEQLVGKALRKDRDERYRTIRELLAELKDINRQLNLKAITGDSELRTTGDVEQPKKTDETRGRTNSEHQFSFPPRNISGALLSQFKLHPKASASVLAIIGMALLIALVGLFRLSGRATESFQNMRLTKLTFNGDAAGERVAVSPDGKYAAYIIQEANLRSLWVKQTATSGNVRVVAPAEGQYGDVVFSHDGNYIFYSLADKKATSAIYQIPAFGGAARKLIENAGGALALSPDGERIAFARGKDLLIAGSEGGEERLIATVSDGGGLHAIAWSPDGKIIVTTDFSTAESKLRLIEIELETGAKKPLESPAWLSVTGIKWLPDASGLILTARDFETQLSQIWLLTYPAGKLRRITNDLNNYKGLSLAADGKSLVSLQQELLSNIWVMPENDAGNARQITFEKGKDEGLSGLAWTADGRIVYTVRITGTQDIWIVNADGSGNRQLTFNARSNFAPAVSPDNRYIVFVSNRSGSPNIWRMDLEGGDLKQLTDSPDVSGAPSVSPDGRWVFYQLTGKKTTVWKVGIDGGEPVRLTDADAGRPVVSPDGKFFACAYGSGASDSPLKLGVIPFDGGPPVKMLDLPALVESRSFRWSPDGKAIVYIDSRNRTYNLWSQTLDGGAQRQLTELKSDRIFRFDISSSGFGYALARGHDSSDVIMIENIKE